MKNQGQKEPLYRKVNTCTHGVRHDFGGDYRHERNTKGQTNSEDIRSPMHGKVKRGLDYTPLFKLLLSKVGKNWDGVYSEAVSRLDQTTPIFWLVAMTEEDKEDIVRIGENRYYSGLFVDNNSILQKVNPQAELDGNIIYCSCCTYSLNGKIVTKKMDANAF